ncbi:MAG: LAGLIDADG family homing endonuclease, partial [Wenzhouxiangella sp.]|nr:LAGLIDADG family homing endonuclease [Wenzhouxiangella sp.]
DKDYELLQQGKVAYRIVKKTRNKGTPSNYREVLKQLGLWGKNAFEKSIPKSYLFSSYNQRVALLQGLMDCDGNVRKFDGKRRASELKYTTVSEKLKEDVIYLANSLGYKTTCYTEVLSSGSLVYRICLTGKNSPFFLSRKTKEFEKFNREQPNKTYITNIKPVGKVFVKCVTIEDPDHLFVLKGFIPTFNSAGGGKSYAMLADPMRDLHHGAFSGLLLRRTNDELRELKQKSRELYGKVFGGDVVWQARLDSYVHKNGGRLWMTYLDKDDDVLRYQGQAFNWIGFDELTQWPTPYAWDYLRSRLRTTSKKLNLYQRATSNPGGPGSWWVKKTFIDPAPWGEAFWATDIETGETMVEPEFNPDGSENEFAGQPLFQRRFIPAKLTDNPFLTRDRNYMRNLMGLPEAKRKQLLEGNWDAAEGMAFTEWNREIHVIEPYSIPRSWRKFRACDYGYSSYSAVVWFAVRPDGQLVVYRDLEVSKVYPEELADMVYKIERQAGDNVSYGVVDGSIFNNPGERGPSRGDRLNKHRGFTRRADRTTGSRIAGKDMLHKLLDVDEFTEQPGIVFFKTCTNCISQIPMLPLDKNNPDDVDTRSRDHIYDAVRYGIMSRPAPVTLEEEFGQHSGYSKSWQPADAQFGY